LAVKKTNKALKAKQNTVRPIDSSNNRLLFQTLAQVAPYDSYPSTRPGCIKRQLCSGILKSWVLMISNQPWL